MSEAAGLNDAKALATAWSSFCADLDALGHEVIALQPAADAQDAAGTLRHLAQLLRAGLDWKLDCRNALQPRLMWYDRDCGGTAPFGPNLDNSYLLVRVRDDRSYRLSLDVDLIDEINISVHTGSPYDGNMTVVGDLNLADLAVKEGSGDIVFSATHHEGAWFEMPAKADYVFIRFYYFDWERGRPPPVSFEMIEPANAAPARYDPAETMQGLRDAMHWLSGAMRFGYAFGVKFVSGTAVNEAGPMRGVPGGGSKIRYGGCSFAVRPDEALLIEFERPEARYWSVQWQKLPWGEHADFFKHVVSMNHTQAHICTDGKVRVILAHRDPGVQNWLDLAGCSEGYVTYRWIWATTEPQPVARLVPFSEVLQGLPPDTPSFNAARRTQQMMMRRRHLSLRF